MTDLHIALRQRFDEHRTLSLTLTVPPGITALVGPSGSGKTTVLKCIAGIKHLEHELIRLGDRDLTLLRPESRQVSMVFQSLALFPHLTALQNVRFGGATETDALAWLERARVPYLAHRKPATFSGGEAQRVALARAFARTPAVLLLDEPFSALDDSLRNALLAELKSHVERLAVPTLFVTHDERDVASLGARLSRLA